MPPSREYPSNPLVGVGALIRLGGKVLLVRRRNPPNKGRWVLPGGLVEVGETVRGAVLREVREELGIRVKLQGLIDVVDSLHLDKKGRVRYHYILVDFLARPLTNTISLDSESYSYGWFTPGEAMKLNISSTTARIIRTVWKNAKSAGHSSH